MATLFWMLDMRWQITHPLGISPVVQLVSPSLVLPQRPVSLRSHGIMKPVLGSTGRPRLAGSLLKFSPPCTCASRVWLCSSSHEEGESICHPLSQGWLWLALANSVSDALCQTVTLNASTHIRGSLRPPCKQAQASRLEDAWPWGRQQSHPHWGHPSQTSQPAACSWPQTQEPTEISRPQTQEPTEIGQTAQVSTTTQLTWRLVSSNKRWLLEATKFWGAPL